MSGEKPVVGLSRSGMWQQCIPCAGYIIAVFLIGDNNREGLVEPYYLAFNTIAYEERSIIALFLIGGNKRDDANDVVFWEAVPRSTAWLGG